MNERNHSGAALPLLLAMSAFFDEVVPQRRAGHRPRTAAPTRRRRAARPGPETVRLPCPHATAARDLDGRIWQHRETGEIRGALWTPAGIEFHNPKTNDTFMRPYRKALQWCEQAADVTPTEAEMATPELSALPPEVPAHPVAEDQVGGGA